MTKNKVIKCKKCKAACLLSVAQICDWDTVKGFCPACKPIQVRVPFVNKIETFRPVGIGAYPYECIAKDKHPNSMIYVSEAYGNGWIASHQLIDTGKGYFELGVA